MAPWCVVASRPSSSPAFANSSAPVQTDSTSSAFVDACLIHSISDRVVHLLAGALTTGDEQHVRLRAVGEPMVRVDAEATTGHDRAGFLGHGQDVEGGRLGEAVGDGEDLERPAEVQHFHVVEDQDR